MRTRVDPIRRAVPTELPPGRSIVMDPSFVRPYLALAAHGVPERLRGLCFCVTNHVSNAVQTSMDGARLAALVDAGNVREIALTNTDEMVLYADLRRFLADEEASTLAVATSRRWLLGSADDGRFQHEAIDWLGANAVLSPDDLLTTAIGRGVLSYDLAGQIRAEWILGGRSLAYERGDDVIGCGPSWNGYPIRPDCINYDDLGTQHAPGPVGVADVAGMFRQAFPDHRAEITYLTVRGAHIFGSWIVRGSHKGTFLGIPPTGHRIEVRGSTVCRLERGYIVERWIQWDRDAVREQLREAITEAHGVHVIRRLVDEVWSRRRFEVFDEIYANDCVRHDAVEGPMAYPPPIVRRLFDLVAEAFPDFRYEVLDVSAHKDVVRVSWMFHGTHLGTYLGCPPTGRQVTNQATAWFRIAFGKIREVRIDWDESAVRAQIGGATKLRVAGTALLTAVEELWSEGNLSLVEQIVSPDYRLFARRGRREVVLATGRHELKNRVLEVRRAFPDLRVRFSYPTDHGEEMVAAFEVSGTHRGKFFDVQPTARFLKYRALYRNRLNDGLVCESHIDLDLDRVVDDLRRS